MYIRHNFFRFYAVFLFFLLFFSFLVTRLFFIQIYRTRYLKSLAIRQHSLFVELEPRRGTIYDRNLRPLAVNIPMDSLYAIPSQIKDKETLIGKIMPVLKLDYSYLRNRLYRDKSFIWIARKVHPQRLKRIKELNLKGLNYIKESRRSYPNIYLASHLIGFAGLDNIGLEGVELIYDNFLKGSPGFTQVLQDGRREKLDIWERMMQPRDGYNLILTIDEVIQYIAERELDRAFSDYHAKQASIIVMNPHRGEILALANRPTFDLNDARLIDADIRRNRAITDIFEPGSSFKVVTAAAAVEEKKVTEDDLFFCENGRYRISNHTLHDHRPHGWLKFKEVIEQSSNIGTTKVAQILGKETLYHYIRLFGFGKDLGIDLPGEISGIVKEPKLWSKTSIGAVPIGHEVGVTALQMVSAISVIANGGLLMRPYCLKETRDKYGEIIKTFSPTLIRKVISTDTANRIKDILVGVIEVGTGRRAGILGFKVAGKTGTAQKLDPDGKYSHNKFLASFIGFVPADDPVIAICIVVDEPKPFYYGGVVCAPVFKRVAGDVLRYLKIDPELKEDAQELLVNK